jgi:hypothetical protein
MQMRCWCLHETVASGGACQDCEGEEIQVYFLKNFELHQKKKNFELNQQTTPPETTTRTALSSAHYRNSLPSGVVTWHVQVDDHYGTCPSVN